MSFLLRRNFRRGDVIRFGYVGGSGDKRNIIGRIVNIRDTDINKLRGVYKPLKRGERSRYLLHVKVSDGTFRNFYDSGLISPRRIGFLGNLLLKWGGVEV